MSPVFVIGRSLTGIAPDASRSESTFVLQAVPFSCSLCADKCLALGSQCHLNAPPPLSWAPLWWRPSVRPWSTQNRCCPCDRPPSGSDRCPVSQHELVAPYLRQSWPVPSAARSWPAGGRPGGCLALALDVHNSH